MTKPRKKSAWIYLSILVIIIAFIVGLIVFNYKKMNPGISVSENDFIIPLYQFRNGQQLSNLKIHYATLGTPVRNGNGEVTNAVLILHWTGASGADMRSPVFQQTLYGRGKPLDARKYYLIIPDDLGHGKSSKPSDGLHTAFPNYGYLDMVNLEHRLVTEKLGVTHLQMVLGVSMGGMHAWLWSELYPDFMDGIMPVAALPRSIDGRNLLWRQLLVSAIRNDPGWKNGNYTKQPYGWIATAPFLQVMLGSVLDFEKTIPDISAAEKYIQEQTQLAATKDANDILYALQASADYDPEPELGSIKTKVYALNFSDDAVYPLELNVLPALIKQVKNSRLVIQAGTADSFGHMTIAHPELWATQVAQFAKLVNTGQNHT